MGAMVVRTSERYMVAVMGRSGAGKSALTLRYTSNRFVADYDPTIEDLYMKHTTISGAPACLEILVANKSDLEAPQWVVREDEVQKLRASWVNCCEVFYTSAKLNRNVSDAFESLCSAIRVRVLEQRRIAAEQQAVSEPAPLPAISPRCGSRGCCRAIRCRRICSIQ